MRSGSRIPGTLECRADLADGHMEPTHGAVADEIFPVPDLGFIKVDGLFDGRRCRWNILPRRADAAIFYKLDRRTHDAVGRNQNGHGRAAHDIRLRRLLASGRDGADLRSNEIVQRLDDPLFRNADQNDRLFVLHQLEPGNHPVRIDTHEDIDRFT